MNRIWIAGSAGSGKTTLANIISLKLDIPVYHRDLITWDENDNIRTEDEQVGILMNITQNEKWIFEGARFTASKIDGRLDRCDTIIHLEINRFVCVYRGIKRGFQTSKRTDIPTLERQPFHFHHVMVVLRDYPKKRKQREDIFELARKKGINIIILKSRKEVDNFIKNAFSDTPSVLSDKIS